MAHPPAPREGPLRPRAHLPHSVDGFATKQAAQEVTSRVWSCVQLSVEWLGGMAPIRTAAVIGAGSWGTAAACCLPAEEHRSSSGAAQPSRLRCWVSTGATTATCLASSCRIVWSRRRRTRSIWRRFDLVCLAVPSRAFRDTVDRLADRLPANADVLLLTKGLLPPDANLPCDYLVELTGDRSVALPRGPAHAADACRGEAGSSSPHRTRAFAARLAGIFGGAGLRCERTDDIVGVQLAGCAKKRRCTRCRPRATNGVNAAGRSRRRIYGGVATLSLALSALIESSFTGRRAQATSSRPSSPRTAAIAAPASCLLPVRRCRRSRSHSARPQRRSTSSPCSPPPCATGASGRPPRRSWRGWSRAVPGTRRPSRSPMSHRLERVARRSELAGVLRRLTEDRCDRVRLRSEPWRRNPPTRPLSTGSSRSSTASTCGTSTTTRTTGPEPSRRRGPHHADLHPGVQALSIVHSASRTAGRCARGSFGSRTTCGELLPRPRAQADLVAGGSEIIRDPYSTEHLVEGREDPGTGAGSREVATG